MKKLLGLLIGVLMVFGVVGGASAVPTSWEDSFDFNPDERISVLNGGHSFFLDLGNDGYQDGMEIFDYTLSIVVYDDNSGWWETDFETVVLSTLGGATSADVALGSVEQGWGLLGEADIEDDGTLNVWVTSAWGDFLLDSASITASGDDGTAPVPEPATVLLFGIGLLGIAGVSRKKK